MWAGSSHLAVAEEGDLDPSVCDRRLKARALAQA
jgi:hypothetical protein